MAIYTVGRRRVVVALLLTSALVLTLDLRGNAVLDRARDAFGVAMDPVETAAEVVTNPVERLWDSYSNYDDLERENEVLRARNDELIGTLAAAEASIIDAQQVSALNDLPSLAGIPTEKAEVVGASANNIDQIIEINKGSLDGVEVGMPVVNLAGLVGRVTTVNLNTSQVMLVIDSRFAIPVEVLGGTGEFEDGFVEAATVDTTPSGLTPEEVVERGTPTTTTTTTTTVPGASDGEEGDAEADPTDASPLDVFADEVPLPQAGDEEVLPEGATTTTVPGEEGADDVTTDGSVPADGSIPVDGSVPTTVAPPAPTTTVPPILSKEFGAMVGRGQGRVPQIRFLQDVPALATLQVGDLVVTAGNSDSLAPAGIPVGEVLNRADRPGVAGPVLEIALHADLDQLNFVQVVLYRPASEVGE